MSTKLTRLNTNCYFVYIHIHTAIAICMWIYAMLQFIVWIEDFEYSRWFLFGYVGVQILFLYIRLYRIKIKTLYHNDSTFVFTRVHFIQKFILP